MDLGAVNIALKNVLAAEYAAQGILVITEVDLPPVFQPDLTDVVFLSATGNCEVFIDARVTYAGADRHWREIATTGEVAGGARLVVRCVDFFAALRTFSRLLANEQQARPHPTEQNARNGWLRILGLSGNPTVEQIKKEYRKLAMINHPDRLAGACDATRKAAEERMRVIVEAHHALVQMEAKHTAKTAP